MSMLSSKEIKYIVGEQMKASPIIKGMEVETIPMGYVIVGPGMKVGVMGGADPVKRYDIKTAIDYPLAAEFFGMEMVYLEAGSGTPSPVPVEMVEAVKDKISIPLIVGGGIRDGDTAKEKIDAGADAIVTGTIIEKDRETIKDIIEKIQTPT